MTVKFEDGDAMVTYVCLSQAWHGSMHETDLIQDLTLSHHYLDGSARFFS